ncbi:serine hydrolase [Sphingomonas sp.]|uniref:serine hydrolase n=1 Tax=Sphingomonas sp. TaxID=28214 RepID=UPI0017DEC115|nr:serine hydrolase [Sphingomonas sp.]MBA4762332.1 serine hydrolase [Sphingomonas sp.]
MRTLMFALALLTVPLAAQGQTTAPSAPAQATQVQAAPELTRRIEALPALINGSGDFEGTFDASFKAQVPKAQFDALGAQLRAQHGKAVGIEQVTPRTPHQAVVRVGFEKSVATIQIIVDPAPPHAISGLLISQVEPRGDGLAQIEADFRALPGTAAYGVYRLGDSRTPVAEYRGDAAMPLGSAFKLWVLAEAARQVQAGTRKWSDVVTLDTRSLPSGITQNWPTGAPVTLHSLATLMISISDNTATDTLLRALGRDAVDAMVARAGASVPGATLPVLTTIEAFQLKSPGNAHLAAAWKAAGPDGRRKLLRDNAARLAATKPDAAMFGAKPLALDVEWFASPRDQAALLDWLRTRSGAEALAIMAVNPQVPGDAGFAYAGFKGGSEPGVIYGSWLVRTKAGDWYAITGGWTRPDAGVETLTFMTLMNRLMRQVAAR